MVDSRLLCFVHRKVSGLLTYEQGIVLSSIEVVFVARCYEMAFASFLNFESVGPCCWRQDGEHVRSRELLGLLDEDGSVQVFESSQVGRGDVLSVIHDYKLIMS